MPCNDYSDFGSNLAYTDYFFSWIGRLALFVSKCFSLKKKKKRWGLALHITQTIAMVKEKVLNTWFKIALHLGSTNRNTTRDSTGNSRAAMCYSICVLPCLLKRILGSWKDYGWCAVSWVHVLS